MVGNSSWCTKRPRTSILGRSALVGIMLGKADLQIRRRACIELTRCQAAQYISEWHGGENSRPNAPDGRRGDLYPAELRAHSYRHIAFRVSEGGRIIFPTPGLSCILLWYFITGSQRSVRRWPTGAPRTTG